MTTLLRCRPDNPGAWLAVEALCFLATRRGTLTLPAWRHDGAELPLKPRVIAGIIGDVVAAAAPPLAPWDAAGPIVLDIRNQLICLDWHCKRDRALVPGRQQLRLISGQVTVPRKLAACVEAITKDRLSVDARDTEIPWLDGQPDTGTWLFDAAGAWSAADLGYSADAVGIQMAGNAVTELLAMVGASVAPWQLDGLYFRYAVAGQPMWSPLTPRGQLRALGWATPESPSHEGNNSDDD